jgi:hypothetical protein
MADHQLKEILSKGIELSGEQHVSSEPFFPEPCDRSHNQKPLKELHRMTEKRLIQFTPT